LDTWLAVFGAVATIVGGAWTAFVYFDKKKQTSEKPRSTTEINAPGGIASARDTVIHGNVTFRELPKGAMGLAALGLLVLALALLNMGDRVTTYNLTQSTVNDLQIPGSFAETALAGFTATGDGLVAAVDIRDLAGQWQSRWNRTGEGWYEGSAQATVQGDEISFLYRDGTSTYDLRARFVSEGILAGGYQNLSHADDATGWIGFVSPRGDIRGYWKHGEWHFWRP
jgi:hypothetical protein